MQRRGPATSTGGGEGAAFVVRAAQGSSRRLDSLGRRVAALRSKTGGQRGTGDAGGVNSSERRNSPSSDSRANSGEVGPGLRGKDLGELPGCTAVLLRCGAGPGRRWRGRSAAAQGGRRGGAERRGGSRALDGAERKVECRGGTRGPIIDRAVDSGVCAPGKKSGEDRGLSAAKADLEQPICPGLTLLEG